MVQALYGSVINERRACAFCWKHHCAMTSKMVKTKECLSKQCNALERYDHEYWRQRELAKQRKKGKNII